MLIITAKLYSQWEFVGLDSLLIKQIYVSGDTIFAGTDNRIDTNKVSGLFKSIDNGNTWIKLDSVLGNGPILSFAKTKNKRVYIIKGNGAYAIGGRIYKSDNEGLTWEKINASDYSIKWLGVSPFDYNKIYAVNTFNNEVYKSVDGGNNWNQISAFPASSHGRFTAFNISLVKDSVLFALVDVQFYQAFYKSTNDGYSWQYVGTPPSGQEISTDNELECKVYMESYFITDNCGLSWKRVDSSATPTSSYLSLYIDKAASKLYLMKTDGIYVSDKQTINWQKLSGTENLPVQNGYQPEDVGQLKNIFLIGKTMYVGTLSGIYKKDDITDVKDGNTFENISYSLSQNYPNPFNPTTTIKYTIPTVETGYIPSLQHVTLKIYDILGREVAALVNKEQSAGNYETEFDGSKLSSGIYIYSIRVYSPGRAGNYAASKKMILAK